MSLKTVTILGSTGSIGVNTLDVVARQKGFSIAGLVANRNIKLLVEQIKTFSPRWAFVSDPRTLAKLRDTGFKKTRILGSTEEFLAHIEEPVDCVISAIVGIAGLVPTYHAILGGSRIGLANKETLVAGGSFITGLAAKKNVRLLPVDSEHNAIFQCLADEDLATVSRLILTASGGPFHATPASRLKKVTVTEALAHPRWRMGRKISIDSATLMNKALEIIEARWLFGLPPEKITAVIHPQSIVHSMVEFVDRSVIAELATTDMRIPIGYALNYPERKKIDLPFLDFEKGMNLTFEKIDRKKFRSIELAYEALARGNSAQIALNAANEIANESFLAGDIEFTSIFKVVEKALLRHSTTTIRSVADILAVDHEERTVAREILEKYY